MASAVVDMKRSPDSEALNEEGGRRKAEEESRSSGGESRGSSQDRNSPPLSVPRTVREEKRRIRQEQNIGTTILCLRSRDSC